MKETKGAAGYVKITAPIHLAEHCQRRALHSHPISTQYSDGSDFR